MPVGDFGPPPETTPKAVNGTHAASETNETIDGGHYYVEWAFNSVGLTSRHRFECWSGVDAGTALHGSRTQSTPATLWLSRELSHT